MSIVANYNSVTLIGRLCADPELKTTQSGAMVSSGTVAVQRPYKKDTQHQTDFFNFSAWGSSAEFLSKYFRKGSPIGVRGKLQTRSWTDREGIKRTATEVFAEEIVMIEAKSKDDDGYKPSYGDGGSPKFEEVAAEDDLPF